MWRAGQEELLAPYVERYFDELPGTAEVHSGWVLADVAEAFFPLSSLDEATVHRATTSPTPLSINASLFTPGS